MTKKDMTRTIAEEMGLAITVVKEVIQMLFDSITETLVEEGRIELRNFGVFEVQNRKARQARNPRTGETVMVPERWVVRFKSGMEMGERKR